QPLELQRQVMIAAGSLVLLGVLLGYALSPWLFLLSGFVGAGLIFAGISGFCGMALLLQRMPWNRRLNQPRACRRAAAGHRPVARESDSPGDHHPDSSWPAPPGWRAWPAGRRSSPPAPAGAGGPVA